MHNPKTSLQAGTATVDITPALSTDPGDTIDLSGYVARIGHAVSVHDPLSARALALSDGSHQAILVVCDLIGLETAFSTEVRDRIARSTGVPEEAVMLACTHTHSGPATLRLNGCGEVSPRYLATLQPKLVDVATRAAGSLQPVTLDAGSTTLPEGAYNRRRDGQPIDTEVDVAWLRTPTGKSVALLVNYGCHPVVMTAENRLVSTDYPGATVRALEAAHGGTAFFLTGADGNVDPVRRGAFEDVTWLAKALAGAVGATLARIGASSRPDEAAGEPGRVGACAEALELPLQPIVSVKELAVLRASYRERLAALTRSQPDQEPMTNAARRTVIEVKIQRAMLAWADATLAQLESGDILTTLRALVQVIRVGDLVLAGIPGELFSGLGRRIKDTAPAAKTFIVGYANQDIGYIPDRAAYEGGGYEVSDAYKYYGYPAALAPEAGEMLIAACRRLMTETGGCGK